MSMAEVVKLFQRFLCERECYAIGVKGGASWCIMFCSQLWWYHMLKLKRIFCALRIIKTMHALISNT